MQEIIQKKYMRILLIIAWLMLIFSIIYMVYNIEELKASDIRYCAKKMNVQCRCWDLEQGPQFYFFVNATDIVLPMSYYEEVIP